MIFTIKVTLKMKIMNVNNFKGLIIGAFFFIGFLSAILVLNSCSKDDYLDNKKNILSESDIEFIAKNLEKSEFTQSKWSLNNGELDIKVIDFVEKGDIQGLISKKKGFPRLKSASIESSDGEIWKETKTFNSAYKAAVYVGDKLDEYGGCVESRIERVDANGDGHKDEFKVYVRPCNWNYKR